MTRDPRILLVDDDRDLIAALDTYLEAHGYTVLQAHDGREGLRVAKVARPDLVIMDVMMDERTEGFFAIQNIRRVPGLATVPIFVLTSLYSPPTGFAVPPDAGWLEHDAFFPKPVDMPALLEAIRSTIGPGRATGLETGSGDA